MYTLYAGYDGVYIIFNQIINLFYEKKEYGLHILPKLPHEHKKINSILNNECKHSCPGTSQSIKF